MAQQIRKFLHHHYRIFLALGVIIALFLVYRVAYAGRILPRVTVGLVNIGGLSPQEAADRLQITFGQMSDEGFTFHINGTDEKINPHNVGVTFDAAATAQKAFEIGRDGSWYQRFIEQLRTPFVRAEVHPDITINNEGLDREVSFMASVVEQPGKDVRLEVNGVSVKVLYDTKPGRVIDHQKAEDAIRHGLETLNNNPISLTLKNDIPHADPASGPIAERQAQKMLQDSLRLSYDEGSFVIPRTTIGSWIVSGYRDNQLTPEINRAAVSAYVTQIAAQIKIEPQMSKISVSDGKVTEFVPPRPGRLLKETDTVNQIIQTLDERRDSAAMPTDVTLAVVTDRPSVPQVKDLEGIVELIGKATTPFTGSHANRIHNIKNGIQFLSGSIIQPGEEFSTVQTLGTIDNTTGYLPELVIKGDATIPEFGGGLCQVSTTLFRAVLNAGLPITERQNHSYRVGYYEHDANGNFIGPGLDATIYQPHPDFKFVNDTGHPVLIYGYVKGDLATFELYGTRDGRTASVAGPYVLSEIPPGDPIYTDTDKLAKGQTQQTEIAHPGGSTIATYTITYPDGTQKVQQFKSYYRPWPARYLVGTGE